MLAEYDVLGKGRTVVGISALHGSDSVGRRNLAGVYTRLGFGSWGILAEHDFANRNLDKITTDGRFGQQASYAQVFYYPREWILVSGIVERLTVERPYEERLWAYKGELATRLSAN